MSITEQELEHLAVLSKLKLTAEEKEKYLHNMDSIIQFLDQLKTPEEKFEISDEEKLRCFSDGELYRRYKAKPTGWHMSATVLQIQDKIILVESDGYGFIRLWGFDTGNLIKSISSGVFINLRGICLWNENYLFAASNDQQIKLFDLYKGKAYKSYKEHIGIVCSLEKIENSQYGQCLLSHGSDGKIKIWGYNK